MQTSSRLKRLLASNSSGGPTRRGLLLAALAGAVPAQGRQRWPDTDRLLPIFLHGTVMKVQAEPGGYILLLRHGADAVAARAAWRRRVLRQGGHTLQVMLDDCMIPPVVDSGTWRVQLPSSQALERIRVPLPRPGTHISVLARWMPPVDGISAARALVLLSGSQAYPLRGAGT